MSKNTAEYKKWKGEMKKELDNLVAKTFERLFSAPSSDYLRIWREISGELLQKYDLVELRKDDPEYELKLQKVHCIFINRRIYAEKEFPFELSTDRTLRFVKQYGKLPKQLPKEWDNFELEERVKAGEERRKTDQQFMAFLDRYAQTHPKYATR